MTFNSIDELRIMLEQAGAANVPGYIDKLRANSKNNEVFDDLLFEGCAALMFLRNGFLVEMQECPDISIKLGNNQFYAEVKHFRLKEQDRIDQANMEAAQDELVPYGDTVPLDGIAAWNQIVQVAKRKTKQFKQHVPNILVIGSSSLHCIDDAIIPTAISRYRFDNRFAKVILYNKFSQLAYTISDDTKVHL